MNDENKDLNKNFSGNLAVNSSMDFNVFHTFSHNAYQPEFNISNINNEFSSNKFTPVPQKVPTNIIIEDTKTEVKNHPDKFAKTFEKKSKAK